MDVIEQVWGHGGIAKRSQIVRTAADRRAVTTGIGSGALRDLGGGWVAAEGAEPDVVAARRLGGTITCVSAAPFYGLQVLSPPDRPHVALPRRRGVGPVAVAARLHREGSWTPPPPHGFPLAPLPEVIGRVLRCLPAEQAAVITDSALNKRLVTVEEIAHTLSGPGSPAARATLERCEPGSRSVIETLARVALRDAGLHAEAAVTIDGVGELDLLVEGCIDVECDGFAYHSGREEYRKDRRRDRALAAKGYLVLRFTWEEIMKDPHVVVRAVLRVLGRE